MSPSLSFTCDGHALAGFWEPPAAATAARDTLLVFCHGLPSGAPAVVGDGGYPALVHAFADRGYPGLFFNFRGARASGGDFSLAGWTRDLTALLDHLERRDTVPHRRVVAVGSSAGALVALWVAAGDARIAGVAALAAPADLTSIGLVPPEAVLDHCRAIGLIRDPAYPPDPARWLAEFGDISAIGRIARVAPRPILLIHGDADPTVPFDHALRLLHASGGSAELKRLPKGGHRLRLDPRAIDCIADWLLRYFP
jgi:putative redox protein